MLPHRRSGEREHHGRRRQKTLDKPMPSVKRGRRVVEYMDNQDPSADLGGNVERAQYRILEQSRADAPALPAAIHGQRAIEGKPAWLGFPWRWCS